MRQRTAKEQQNFDIDPPRCGTCIHRQPEVPGVQKKFYVPGVTLYQPLKCKIGKFTITDDSICDRWENKRGIGLDL